MFIGKKMEKALNDQIQAELSSAYLYLAMVTWFEKENYSGFAHWMKKQTSEENEHAMKFFEYVHERGGVVELKAIEAPKSAWKAPIDVFKEVLAHEQLVTKLIYGLADVATAERDYGTLEFLQWFIKEQVEEEANASAILDMLTKVGDSTVGLIAVDQQLAQR